MTDRELLELAAKAEGRKVWRGDSISQDRFFCECAASNGVVTGREWNPLTDDGDALRLAVKLRINIHNNRHGCEVRWGIGEHIWENHTYEIAATRRAIVRAAAEYGKGLLSHDEFIAMFPGRFPENES